MNTKQTILAVLLGVGITLSGGAFANDQCDHSGMHERSEHHFEKRMSALHDELKLSASQEAGWKDFSAKMKPAEMAKHEHQDCAKMSTPDRLDHMLANMKSHEQKLADRAAAVRTFYDTLSPEQKTIFDASSHGHRQHHDMHDRM